jgi:hypothetical protein
VTFDVSILLQVLIALAACAGAYAAIRADLARLHARVDIALMAGDTAHRRIDDLLANMHGKS